MPRQPFESEFLYGLHDPGGERIMRDAGCRGWILFTEEIGLDPNNHGGSDRYASLSAEGFGVIVRLNRGYYPNGTIPHSSEYANFAQRCANFVRNSPGAKIWIIGNEMNLAVERSGVQIDWSRALSGSRGVGEPSARELRDLLNITAEQARGMLIVDPGEVITPELYVRCYSLCRNAIRRLPGHEDDLVLIGSVAPWNINTTYGSNPSGDWVQYFKDILTLLGPDGCDGITLHTYTDGHDLGFIDQDHVMGNPDFSHLRYHFRSYQDFMAAIPDNMRHLPVYITETDQNLAWEDKHNSVWVQRAYAEIDRWNREPGHQQIRALILYRWPRVGEDRWWIEGKGGVIEDFKRAMQQGYRWNPDVVPGPATQPTSEFSQGQQVYASAFVNVRRSPGYVGKPSDDVHGQIAYGTPVTILESSSQADGLTWWPVRSMLMSAQPVEGWVAEVAPSGKRLLSAETPPVQPGTGVPTPSPTGAFAVGEAAAIVAPNSINIRHTPGYLNKPQGDVAAVLEPGTTLTIVNGPQEVDDLYWWQVSGTRPDGEAITGWLAEAGPSGARFLAPVRLSEAITVRKPFQGNFGVTQRWGSNPEFYKRFTYDFVPLKGHNGIDFGTPTGTPLVAADAGRVKKVSFEPGGFGHHILLQHTWGESLYAHLEQVGVPVGQVVNSGDVIGVSGNSGAGTGPHLHFGIRINPYRRTDGWGGFADPAPFMNPNDLIIPRAGEEEPTPMAEEIPGRPRP
jgi:murein DD-endopeptidase MepM/ murein hydrolase activator NlpD